MSPRERFRAEAAKRILITDGAFGTEIQNWKLSEADYAGALGLTHDQKGNNDILALTKPEVPEAIHRAYFEAGADIAETNTFSANRISQADYGAESLVREINVESAKLARRLADEFEAKDGRPRFVAGAIGPTNKTLSLSAPTSTIPGYREIDFDHLKDVYREQVDALVEGGADFILIETVFDTLNAKAGVMAALEAGVALGPRPADHAVDDADRSQRAQSFGAYGRGVLACGATCQAADDRAQLLVRGGAASAARQDAVRALRHADHGLSERGAAQRTGRVRRDAADDRRTGRRVGGCGTGQRARRVLRIDPGAYRGDGRAGAGGGAAAGAGAGGADPAGRAGAVHDGGLIPSPACGSCR